MVDAASFMPTTVTVPLPSEVGTATSSPATDPSTLPPDSAARSTTTDPGRIARTMSAVTRSGAGRPGIAAVVILLLVMNWFFHKVYWTDHIKELNSRKRELVDASETGESIRYWGFFALGFTAVYREGFEVVLFLQNWRATLIPILAVPVSLLGAFGGLLALGYSINTLTLFGMVLAIGMGLGAVFEAFPLIYVGLKYGGALYLCYLAWQIATADAGDT